MAKRCPREGTKVVFNPNPASRALYSDGYGLPNPGETGTITTVPLPGGRKTCMPGPGGGLVYVKWASGSTMGVSSYDIEKVKRGAPAVCAHPLCTKKVVSDAQYCREHAGRGGLGAVESAKNAKCPRGCESRAKIDAGNSESYVPLSWLATCQRDAQRVTDKYLKERGTSWAKRLFRRGGTAGFAGIEDGLDDFEARDLLYQWHGGGGSGVYQVASMMDHGVPEGAYERARGELAYVRKGEMARRAAGQRMSGGPEAIEELTALIGWLNEKIASGE